MAGLVVSFEDLWSQPSNKSGVTKRNQNNKWRTQKKIRVHKMQVSRKLYLTHKTRSDEPEDYKPNETEKSALKDHPRHSKKLNKCERIFGHTEIPIGTCKEGHSSLKMT